MDQPSGVLTNKVPTGTIEEIARGVVDLLVPLRGMEHADADSWERLHMRIMDMGVLTPDEVNTLHKLVSGLVADDLRP